MGSKGEGALRGRAVLTERVGQALEPIDFVIYSLWLPDLVQCDRCHTVRVIGAAVQSHRKRLRKKIAWEKRKSELCPLEKRSGVSLA